MLSAFLLLLRHLMYSLFINQNSQRNDPPAIDSFEYYDDNESLLTFLSIRHGHRAFLLNNWCCCLGGFKEKLSPRLVLWIEDATTKICVNHNSILHIATSTN